MIIEPISQFSWRPRFSLLTALLLTTIAGLIIMVATLWREVEPLRAELRQLRTEVGRLTIDDPQKAYAIAIRTDDPMTSRWRIYLPPRTSYTANCYAGIVPSDQNRTSRKWLDAVKQSGSGSSSGGSAGGEFLVTVRLVKKEGTWYVVYHTSRGNLLNGSQSLPTSFGEWLGGRGVSTTSTVSADGQMSFAQGVPILLLHMPKPLITELPGGGWSSRMPTEDHEGIVVWIE